MKDWIFRKIYDRWRFKRLNVIKTLYANFILLPFHQAIHLPIYIYGPTSFRTFRRSKFIIDNPISSGMIKIGETDPFRSYGSDTFFELKGKCVINGRITIRRGSRITVRDNGILTLNNNSFISDNVTIACSNSIEIGENTVIGNNCSLMDNDFHCVVQIKDRIIKSNTYPVVIGPNNWIGSWNFIKKGCKTPEGTILAGPYSLLCKDYIQLVPPFSLLAGCPAKLIKEGVKMIIDKNLEKELTDFFITHPDISSVSINNFKNNLES